MKSIYEEMAQAGQIEEAIAKCEADLEVLKQGDSKPKYAHALHAMASMLKYYTSEYAKSLEFLSLEIQFREMHQLPGLDAAYLKSAIVNMYLYKKEEVLSNAELCLSCTENQSVRATALNVIGDTIFQENTTKADRYFREAEQLFEAAQDHYNLAHVRLSYARLLGFNGDIGTALSMCEQELAAAQQDKNPGIFGTAYLRLAEIHSYSGDRAQSKNFAQKAHTIGEENNWKVLMEEAEVFLGD